MTTARKQLISLADTPYNKINKKLTRTDAQI